jgi:heme oxygenase
MLRLRHETAQEHRQVEDVAYSRAIMDGALTLDQYRDLMRKNYLIHAQAEPLLEQVEALMALEGLDVVRRRKAHFLAADLELLQSSLPEPTEPWTAIPRNLNQALGMMYVLEGSSLGGAVIQRALAKNPEIAALGGFHFYGCYGPEIGTLWKTFGEVVEAHTAREEDQNEVVSFAKTTFDAIRRIFAAELVSAHA